MIDGAMVALGISPEGRPVPIQLTAAGLLAVSGGSGGAGNGAFVGGYTLIGIAPDGTRVPLAVDANGVIRTAGSDATAQAANVVQAGPAAGGSALPTYRALVAADLPTNLVKSSATLIVAASNAKFPLRADYQCDGTGDQVEINAALTALPAAGGTVYLSEGTFTIAAPINVPANCKLVGAGRMNTVITLANGSNCVMIQNTAATNGGIMLSSFQLNGNTTNQTGTGRHGIMLGRAQNTGPAQNLIFDVYVYTCRGSGIVLYSNGNSRVISCDTYGNAGTGADGCGINLINCQECAVIGGIMASNVNAGVGIANFTLTPGSRGNQITNVQSTGNAHGFYVDDGEHCTFSQCYSLNSTTTAFNLFGAYHQLIGCHMWASGWGVKLNAATNILINGCHFVSNGSGTIQLISTCTLYESGNRGLVGYSSGVGTILSGAATVTINHNFPGAPSGILVQGAHLETAAAIVTSITATQFTVTIPLATTADRSVYWQLVPA